jgi:hypothetical protein
MYNKRKELRLMNDINLWTVQRCTMPQDFINPFGNNITDINDAATQEALSKVIKTDYMGAAEYEWGEFPKRLAKFWELGSSDDLALHSILMPDHFAVDRLYIICHWEDIIAAQKAMIELVQKSEKKGVNEGYWPEVSKADHGSFRRVLLNEDGDDLKTKGWISMQNNLAWFVDEDMARGFFHLMQGKKNDIEEDYYNTETFKEWSAINPLQEELAL